MPEIRLQTTASPCAAQTESRSARRGRRYPTRPTSLSAGDEAAGIDVLCSDKTGTLTRNELALTAVHPLPGFDQAQLLAFAALASSDGGQDPVDAAIRAAAVAKPDADAAQRLSFIPFDPASKTAEASVCLADGSIVRVVKGAWSVLAVASGAAGKLQMAGIIALSDPPRADSAALIAELAGLGVRTIMVTGDAADYAIFAGVLPEDKYRLVKALQQSGHLVGMCGDGANDAPALRQAQMGIAVATDVAKSARRV